jgi:hypothetical protein
MLVLLASRVIERMIMSKETQGYNSVPEPLFPDADSVPASGALRPLPTPRNAPAPSASLQPLHDPTAYNPVERAREERLAYEARERRVREQYSAPEVASAPKVTSSIPQAILDAGANGIQRPDYSSHNGGPAIPHQTIFQAVNNRQIEGNALIPGGGDHFVKPGVLPVRPPVISGGLSEAGQQAPAPVESNSAYKQGTTPLGTPQRPGNQGS